MSLYVNEEWRNVVGYEGLYLVSNYGRVKRKAKCRGTNAHILAQTIENHGYIVYSLYKNQKRKHKSAHRLVAEAFIEKVEGKDYVNHIDGNKLNNHVSNLEWVTFSENVRHAIAIGLLVPNPSKEALVKARKANMRSVVRSDGKRYESIEAAARDVGVRGASIYAALKKGHRSAGWRWEYEQ